MKEAKDKAEELIEKFGIEKAFICVVEIIHYQPFDIYTIEQSNNVINYWKQVKQEILNRQ